MEEQELEMISEEEAKKIRAFNRKVRLCAALYVVFCVALVVVFKVALVFSLVPSSSMEGTIKTWDFLISSRYDVDADELERYDILIFTPPDNPDKTYLKRLIGLPGETIEVSNGKVYADGVELDQSFVNRQWFRRGDGVYEVPEGHYFFLGDNRDNSKDSRFWDNKYVPLENILAKAKYIVFPPSDAGSLEYEAPERAPETRLVDKIDRNNIIEGREVPMRKFATVIERKEK